MSRWLRPYGPPGAVRLLCFHYAGGHAAMFRDWPGLLPPPVQPVAVQLPGRSDRHAEPPYSHMDPLVRDLVAELRPVLSEPYACWGFSMGARVALSLTYALRAAGLPLPVRLFVANSAAPVLRTPVGGWDSDDAGLVDYLRRLGGTPDLVLEHPDLRALFLPAVRADLTVVATCPVPDRPPLPVPITAFAGADDPAAPPAQMRPWAAETTADFTLHTLPGHHFLDPTTLRHALTLAATDLLGAATSDRHP